MQELREGDKVRVSGLYGYFSATVSQDLAEVGESGKYLGMRVRIAKGERVLQSVVFDGQRADKVAAPAKAPKMTKTESRALYRKAQEAGAAAASECRPTPMVVEQHANMMDDSSPVEKSWVVAGGVCGFAWVRIRPASSSFARWVIAQELGRTDSYAGGVIISARVGGQSLEIQEAWARAFARVLCEAGVEAHVDSRMD